MTERLELYGPWFANMKNGCCCKKCGRAYVNEEDADEFGTGLCYECFEDGVEEADIRRRERIARNNEY